MFNWNGGDTATRIHTHTHTHTHILHSTHRLEKVQRVVIPFGSHRQTFVAPLKERKKRKKSVDSTKATAFTLDRSFVVGDRGPRGKKKNEKKKKKKEKIPFYDRLYVFLRVFSAF